MSLEKGRAGGSAEGDVWAKELGLTGALRISEKIHFCPPFPDEMRVRCPGDLKATETEDRL